MDGAEILSRVRKNTPHLLERILVISAAPNHVLQAVERDGRRGDSQPRPEEHAAPARADPGDLRGAEPRTAGGRKGWTARRFSAASGRTRRTCSSGSW